jgi:hypothetical protein
MSELKKKVIKKIETPAFDENRMTSLTVKVSDKLRIHWLTEAKKRRTSLSAVIVKHLTEEFGTPD